MKTSLSRLLPVGTVMLTLLAASCRNLSRTTTGTQPIGGEMPAIPQPINTASTQQPADASQGVTQAADAATPTESEQSQWRIYDPDPAHLWNRIFRQFFRRTALDGREYGWDALDPLLWHETTHLLEGESHREALRLLDEFLATEGETHISNLLKRALFQRDLWAVYDWLSLPETPGEGARRALQMRLALILIQLALTREQIDSLPDNYTAAVLWKPYPGDSPASEPHTASVPAGLREPEGEWILLGRKGGPLAQTHTEEYPFFGRSAFQIYIRIPGSRADRLAFLQSLSLGQPPPALPSGAQLALVRRTLLIAADGDLALSPITELIQLRSIRTDGADRFLEFRLDRELLFAGISGGLAVAEKEIPLFRSHGDVFQFDGPALEVETPMLCPACHIDSGLGITGLRSLLSFSRARFPLPGGAQPVLTATTPELEAQTVIDWKHEQSSWQILKTSWATTAP